MFNLTFRWKSFYYFLKYFFQISEYMGKIKMNPVMVTDD